MSEPGEVDRREALPKRSSGLTLVGLLVGAVLVTMLLGQLADPDPSPRPHTSSGPAKPVGADSVTHCPMRLGGMTLGNHVQARGSALERWECKALNGPWSVVIRAAQGHFGARSAVVTFPVDPAGSGVPSARPPGALWNPVARRLVWPLGASHAQIVGDLGQATLENLAMRITLERQDISSDGRPSFWALAGFTAAAAITYGPPVVHEMTYDNGELTGASRLGLGSIHTGVQSGPSYESLAFEAHATPAGFVRGKPAIYVGVQNDRVQKNGVQKSNGTLAWESAPGQVSYIGFTGFTTRGEAIKVLRALADTGRMLTPAQWETRERAQVDPQPATSWSASQLRASNVGADPIRRCKLSSGAN